MSTQIENAEVSVGCPPPSSSRSGEGWKTFQFYFHDFKNLCTTKGHYIKSPKFICNGHQWELSVYPGGYSEAAEGQVSVYLQHFSEGRTTTRFGIQIIDKFGKEKRAYSTKKEFLINSDPLPLWGWHNYISRSVILDESQNILDRNGTLTVVVSMEEEPTTVFVPQNPFAKMMKDMFDDKTTADVCFEVSTAGETEEEEDDDGGTKRVKSTSHFYFYAHHCILEHCAPMLARMYEPNNDMGKAATASVDDVKPDIFRHLLSYVYGWSVPEEELEAHAKDIIDAADKYSIVNLKLEAEVAYVKSTDISLDNAMDNLLYADSRNCALLKEAVMNFLADNHSEAAANISFTDCPGNVVKDLLIAFGRNNANETNAIELTTLWLSDFRREIDNMGLEVDGSREAMIESIFLVTACLLAFLTLTFFCDIMYHAAVGSKML